MKKIAFFLSLLAVPAMLASCGGSDSPLGKSLYSMTALPTKFKAEIPASITGAASPDKSSARKSIQRTAALKASVGESSTGCSQIKSMTMSIDFDFQTTAMMAVVCDAAISQNSIPADEIEHAGTVKLTQGMIDAMKAVVGGSEDLSDLDSMVGQEIPGKVTYSDNLTVTKESPYSSSVSLATEAMEDSSAGTDTFYWSSDKKSTKLVSTYADYSMEVSYNDVTGYTKVLFDDKENGYSSLFTIQKTENGGSVFYCNQAYNDNSGMAGSYLIEGYADDDGGYVEMTCTSGMNVYKSFESFDAAGKVTADTSYADAYSQNEDVAADFMAETGLAVNVSGLTEGEYLVCADASVDMETWSDVIGIGVADGKGNLIIQNVSGGAYAAFESSTSASGTFYLSCFRVSDDALAIGNPEQYSYTR